MSVRGKKPNGQPGPHASKTVEVTTRRFKRCLELLGEGRYKGQIKRTMAAEFGISTRSAERYITRCRAFLRAECGKPIGEIREESVGFCYSLMQDPGSTNEVKFAARKHVDTLLGVKRTELPAAPTVNNTVTIQIVRNDGANLPRQPERLHQLEQREDALEATVIRRD